ncbi:hypothetical protein RRG08_034580 [Elysia crispata]|uniref:Uncharacterized protein n=1 Tax=Elysia crispata TaxID=231223 RepID=A0AAE1B277_9GAST|nr:hypothetical protein RRG08_034580 [Elysia crispata]
MSASPLQHHKYQVHRRCRSSLNYFNLKCPRPMSSMWSCVAMDSFPSPKSLLKPSGRRKDLVKNSDLYSDESQSLNRSHM